MQLKYYTFSKKWNEAFDTSLDSKQTLVLVFGSSDKELVKQPLQELRKAFKNSIIIGASTAGEILMDEMIEDSLVVSVLKFETTQITLATQEIKKVADSFNIGKNLADKLNKKDLKSIFNLSDGLNINGSQLTNGFNSVIDSDTVVSGGLASDNSDFLSTWVIVNGEATTNYVSAIGLYGDNIRVGYGSHAGWDILGIQKKITKSTDNVVYTIDNKPILDIYKNYLGEKAKDLPASGLLFPLGICPNDAKEDIIVRTVLGIDEERKSITFAGDIPEGTTVCLMKSNNDKLISAALNAGKEINLQDYNNEAIISIAISCIGRKLVLKQRVEEELEATLENLPKNTLQVGFYSYGEISPTGLKSCDLHNQTMTITTIWEKDA